MMRATGWCLLALLSLTCAEAGRRPRYGGTLLMEMHEAVRRIDPMEDSPLLPLVFDRLTVLDPAGQPAPALAVSWTRDADARRWEFRLRPGVKYHDGSALTAGPALAAALESALPQISVKARGDTLVFESSRPQPALAARLAVQAYVFARTAEGEAIGTGPFRVARWDSGRHASLAANEEHWRGRPFPDGIEIAMGRSPRDQVLSLEAGKADLVQLAPQDARRARRVWASAPVELLAVVFRDGAVDTRLREALAAAADRAAIHNVIFQRAGEPAGGLLPQWISGYAFLFPTASDLPRARKLAGEAPVRALSLGYEPEDRSLRLIAERLALNARDAGIAVAAGPNPRADALVRRLPLGSPERAVEGDTAEARYHSERAALQSYRIVPLLHVPVTYGVSARVRTWTAPGITPAGELRLADVWLESRP